MMQLKRTYFVAALVLMLVAGATPGAVAGGRTDRPPQAAAPTAPVLPVQMPLNTGTFAGVAEIIKPAVININTVSKGGTHGSGGRPPPGGVLWAGLLPRGLLGTPAARPPRTPPP